MKKLFYLCSILLSILACQLSPRLYKYSQPAPDSLSQNQIDSLTVAYKGYNAVYLKNDIITENFLNPNWRKNKISSISYVILNPLDEEMSTFAFNANGRRVNNIFVRVIYPNQETLEYQKKDCKLEKTSTSEVYKIAYPNITKGTIIQETVDYECYPYSDETLYLKKDLPMIDNKYTIVIPDFWKGQAKNNATYQNKISIKNENKKNIFEYHNQNINAYKEEPFSPSMNEMDDILEYKITKASSFGLFNGFNYKYYNYWSEAYLNTKTYIDKAANVREFSFDKLVNSFETKTPSRLEIADSIVTYMQNNFECDNSNSYTIGSMYDKIKKKKANALLITGFTKKLLGLAKIDSDIIFCHLNSYGAIDYNYVSTYQFNIPALIINIENKKFIAMPYIKYLNMFTTIPDLKNSKCINLDKAPKSIFKIPMSSEKFEEKNLREINNLFTDIPYNNNEKNFIKETYHITLNQDGMVNIKEKIELSNLYNYQMKPDFNNKKADELEKMIKELLAIKTTNVKLISYSIENLDNNLLPFVIKIEYSIDNLLSVMPDEMIFQTSDLLSPASITSYKVKPSERENPIRITDNQSYIKDIYIHFPENMTVQNKLSKKSETNKFGSFINEWRIENNTLIIYQARNLNRILAPKEDYPILLNVASENINNDINTIIFSLKE